MGQDLKDPWYTITSRDRFGLVTVSGQDYQIADICMRILQPHELYAGQVFPEIYVINRDDAGWPYAKKEQVARVGNLVPPDLSDAW